MNVVNLVKLTIIVIQNFGKMNLMQYIALAAGDLLLIIIILIRRRRRRRQAAVAGNVAGRSRTGGVVGQGGAEVQADLLCMYSVPVCTCVCCRARRCRLDPGFESTTTNRFSSKFDCEKNDDGAFNLNP